MGFLDKNGVERLWMHILAKIGAKVDKVNGKGLSTNDFTDDYKNKLDGIEDSANNTVVDSTLDAASTNPVQNKVVHDAINELSDAVSDITPDSINAVKKSGDTMTGKLYVPMFGVRRDGNNYPSIEFYASDGKTKGAVIQADLDSRRRVSFYQYSTAFDNETTKYYEKYSLPPSSGSVAENKTYDILTTKTAVTLEQGGTNATTQLDALKNITGASGNIKHTSEIYSTLADVGLVTASCTTQELIDLMPNSSSMEFAHNKDWTVKLTDAPDNYGHVVLYRSYNNTYNYGMFYSYNGKVYAYKYHPSNESGQGWKRVYTGADTDEIVYRGIVVADRGTGWSQYVVRRTDSDGILNQTEYTIDTDKDESQIKYRVNGTVVNGAYFGKDYTTFGKPASVASGGTGATTAKAALENLGVIYSETEPTGAAGQIWLRPI